MTEFKVVGVTQVNDKGEGIQTLINQIIDSYKAKGELKSWEGLTDNEIISENMGGSEFEFQILKGKITLKIEPTNPYDPNAVKVFMRDAKGKQHHVGYIPKENTREVYATMKKFIRIDVGITGGRYKTTDFDDDDNEIIINEELTRGLLLHPVDVVDYVEGNAILNKFFVRPSRVNKVGKIITRIAQVVIVVSLLLLILIFIIV